MVNDRGFEDVTERNPVKESQHSFESDLDERSLVGFLEDFDAKREDFGKLLTLFKGEGDKSIFLHNCTAKEGVTYDLSLECLGLCCCHLFRREFEDFLREKFEDNHVVFAD